MSDFVHLHTHSDASLLDGAQSVEQIVERVSAMGQSAVAITDHGWLAGAIRLVKAAEKHAVKPIVGMETYVSKQGRHDEATESGWHLTLLAQNATGYRNLVRLTSIAHQDGFHQRPHIDFDLLTRYNEGVIVLSGCWGAQLPQAILRDGVKGGRQLAAEFQRVFGDRYFIEIQNHGATGGVDHVREENKQTGEILMGETQMNDALVEVANSLGIAVVAANDAHYTDEADGPAQNVALCLGTGGFLGKQSMTFAGYEHGAFPFYLKDEQQMLACSREAWWAEACRNTAHVASMVEESVIDMGQQITPMFPKERILQDEGFQAWRRTRS